MRNLKSKGPHNSNPVKLDRKFATDVNSPVAGSSRSPTVPLNSFYPAALKDSTDKEEDEVCYVCVTRFHPSSMGLAHL